MTETMMSGAVTVLPAGKERGGTGAVPTQTSMGCTSVVRATVMVLCGTISMPLRPVHAHFAIQI